MAGFWNHRVFRHTTDGEWFAIHEAFYAKRGDTVPQSWTDAAVYPMGETEQELREDLERMLKALDKPTLDYEPRTK